MKFSCAFLALCASSNAFAPNAPKSMAVKPLHSMPPGGPQVGTAAPGTGIGGAMPQGAGSAQAGAMARAEDPKKPKTSWNSANTVRVQGGSLRTWSFASTDVQAVQVRMKTGGRPLNANVDLWQGPDNTPQKMGVYIEDGAMRPFNAVISTPWGQNTVALRNTAQMEFPFDACVEADIGNGMDAPGALASVINELSETSSAAICQGGAVKTYSFSPTVASVQVLLRTDGRPMNARIELLQGPNNNKQVMEVYTEDGLERPFFAVLETPQSGNVVRIQNTSPLEFPLNAVCEPYMIATEGYDGGVIVDGGIVRR